MINISKDMLEQACYEFILQERNDGCWAGNRIPIIFYEIRDAYLPTLINDPSWVSVIEALVKMNATRRIGEDYVNRMMDK